MFYTPSLYTSSFPTYSPYSNHERAARERARVLAQQRAYQRARRAQYLPHEVGVVGLNNDDDSFEARMDPREMLKMKRRQEELEHRQREDERRRWAMEERREEETQAQSLHAREQPEFASRPPNTPSAVPERPGPSSKSAQYTERHDETATKIQTAFRTHRSLGVISTVESQFHQLKDQFALPPSLDFQGPNDTIVSISTSSADRLSDVAPEAVQPKLAYTPNNYILHAYLESLNRLLMKLDGVESWGTDAVRRRRKGVVMQIEAEATRLEAHWKKAWADYISKVGGRVPDGGISSVEERPAHQDSSMDDSATDVADGRLSPSSTPLDNIASVQEPLQPFPSSPEGREASIPTDRPSCTDAELDYVVEDGTDLANDVRVHDSDLVELSSADLGTPTSSTAVSESETAEERQAITFEPITSDDALSEDDFPSRYSTPLEIPELSTPSDDILPPLGEDFVIVR